MERLVFASALLVFLSAAFPRHAKADDYEGEALHRYPALRIFWREFITEAGTLVPPWLRQRYVTGNWEGQRNSLWELSPCLIVQPDLQYSIQPGGTGSVPNALIIGVQLAANF